MLTPVRVRSKVPICQKNTHGCKPLDAFSGTGWLMTILRQRLVPLVDLSGDGISIVYVYSKVALQCRIAKLRRSPHSPRHLSI